MRSSCCKVSGRGKEGVVTIFSILLNEEFRVKYIVYECFRMKHSKIYVWDSSTCICIGLVLKFMLNIVYSYICIYHGDILCIQHWVFLILKVILPYMVSISICFVYLQAFCDFPPLFASLKEKHHKKACYKF